MPKKKRDNNEKGIFGIFNRGPIRSAIKRIWNDWVEHTHKEDIW